MERGVFDVVPLIQNIAEHCINGGAVRADFAW